MAKVDAYPLQTTVLGTHRLYLFDTAAKQDFQVSLDEIASDVFGSAAMLDAGTGPGELVALDANSLIPLGLLPPEFLSGGGSGSGDVIGPASVTDGRVALFDGTTGNLLKQSAALLGTAAWLNVGTSASNIVQLDGDGKLPAVDGSNLTGLSAGSGDVVGPDGGVTDGQAVVFDSTTGKLVKGGPVLGTAAGYDVGTAEGEIALLGTDGKFDSALIPAGGGTLDGQGLIDLIDANAADIELAADQGASLINAVQQYDPDAILTANSLVNRAEECVDDTTTNGPALGAAVGAAILTQAAASVQSWLNSMAYRIGKWLPMFTELPAEGGIVIVGPSIDGNLPSLISVPDDAVEQVPDTWPHAHEDTGLIEYLTDGETVARLRKGIPASQEVTPAAGVLSYDADAIPNAFVDPITAKLWLNPSIWGTVSDQTWQASRLVIPTDGSARDIDIGTGTQAFPSAGCDIFLRDLTNVDTLPFTVPADSLSVWELGLHRNRKPYLRLIDIGYEAQVPTVSYLGAATPTSGSVGTRTLTASAIGAHQSGDMLLFTAYNTANASTPVFDGSYTTVSGIGPDGITGSVTVAWKIAASSAETGTCTLATQLHCVRIRKAGGSAPQVQATVQYNRAGGFGLTTSTWAAFTATNAGLIVGGHTFVSGDGYGAGSPLRTEYGSPIYEFSPSSPNNRFVLGVAEHIAASTAWGATTTTKSGGTGKDITFSLAIY